MKFEQVNLNIHCDILHKNHALNFFNAKEMFMFCINYILQRTIYNRTNIQYFLLHTQEKLCHKLLCLPISVAPFTAKI